MTRPVAAKLAAPGALASGVRTGPEPSGGAKQCPFPHEPPRGDYSYVLNLELSALNSANACSASAVPLPSLRS